MAATTAGTVPGAGTNTVTRNDARSRPAQARGGDGGSTPFAEALEAGEQEAPQRARPVRAPALKRPAQPPEAEAAQPNAAPSAAPVDRREPASAAPESGPKKAETQTGDEPRASDGQAAGAPADAAHAAETPADKSGQPTAAAPAAPAATTAPPVATDGEATSSATGGTPAVAGPQAAGASVPGAQPGQGPAEPAVPAPASAAPADPAKMAGTPPQPASTLPEAELAAAGQAKGSRPSAMSAETTAAAHPAETVSKSDARSEFRAELAGAQGSQLASAAAEARPAAAADAPPLPPAPQPATSAGSGPLSLVSDVAQKVAAQTSAPGSVVPVHAVAVAIAARANAGSTRFDIRLDPAELGRIEVSLTLDREGRVKSKIVAEKPETLELLQRDQRNLERTLNQAGLSTSEGSVEFSLKDQGGQGMQRDRENREGGPPAQPVIAAAPPDVLTQLSAATYARLAAARGGIDIRI